MACNLRRRRHEGLPLTTYFDDAFAYLLRNEGGYSNDPEDHGGKTQYGVTQEEARQEGITDVRKLSLEQAKDIYRRRYWIFDGLRDRRIAIKCFDVVVNFGIEGGVRTIQRAAGVRSDGIFGPQTEAALNTMNPEEVLERVSMCAADRYVDICVGNKSQLVFLKGWVRRSIRRPSLS